MMASDQGSRVWATGIYVSFCGEGKQYFFSLGPRRRIEPRQPNKSLLLLFFRKEDSSL
jgi:hypothetical protein